MKKLAGLILLSILIFPSINAQKATYSSATGITFGVGGGKSYQRSDIFNSDGFALDAIVGFPLYRAENAFLDIDGKFRFMAGRNRAYDHRFNTDLTFSNIQYNFYSYDLELWLTLNRLRERTGIVVSGFAGAGVTHSRTFLDQFDAANNPYDFSVIDRNQDSDQIYKDLRDLSDGNFETALVSRAALLPTAGFFLGYQFGRSLTLGFEYKANISLSEENGFVGINMDNRVVTGSGPDINNYASVGIRWLFGTGSGYSGGADGTPVVPDTYVTPPGNNTRPTPAGTSRPLPSVEFTNPSFSPANSTSANQQIAAKVTNVSGSESISLLQNGFPNYRFSYNPETDVLSANIQLREGENAIRIKASNPAGSAEDQMIINFGTARKEAVALPEVEFTTPLRSRVTTNEQFFDVLAYVKNIEQEDQIRLTVDDTPVDFTFDPYGRLVKTSIILYEGENELVIRGRNEAGSAEDQAIIIYIPTRDVENTPHEPVYPPPVRVYPPTEPVSPPPVTVYPPAEPVYTGDPVYNVDQVYVNDNRVPPPEMIVYAPEVDIRQPSTRILKTYKDIEEVRAVVLNVESKEQIRVKINGYPTRDFSYDHPSRKVYMRVALSEGQHEVSIEARNPAGSALDEQVFIKEIPPCPVPEIRLLEPFQSPYTTKEQQLRLRAEVSNVPNSNQIDLVVNGRSVSFSFSRSVVSKTLQLREGVNTITVSAATDCGEDRLTTRILYSTNDREDEEDEEPCYPPEIDLRVSELDRSDATHELFGMIRNVENRSDITVTLDGRTDTRFQFIPSKSQLTANYRFGPGTHNIEVSAKNECGSNRKNVVVAVASTPDPTPVPDPPPDPTPDPTPTPDPVPTPTPEPDPEPVSCGVRINPGNSEWQFCLIGYRETFNRENLSNSNFSYSGPASQLFIMPTAGGGEVIVGGQPYTLRSGQYYLFTGNLEVEVSNSKPGAMGQWTVCVEADRAPVSGNGNNRPKSPCEKGNEDGNNNGNSSNHGRGKSNVSSNNSSNSSNGRKKSALSGGQVRSSSTGNTRKATATKSQSRSSSSGISRSASSSSRGSEKVNERTSGEKGNLSRQSKVDDRSTQRRSSSGKSVKR